MQACSEIDQFPANCLTLRQRDVVQLIAEGASTKEMATSLGVYRNNIMHRLNCHSVAELVRYALRNQIVKA